MGRFEFSEAPIKGVRIIEPKVFADERGCFLETYNFSDFKAAGIGAVFVQDNESRSVKAVLRGLHYQKTHPQAKLVRVISGEVFDVAVDIRKGSPTYGKWFGILLSGENKKQLYIPEGFAHGFLVLSETAEFAYKCTDFYRPADEGGIVWNDPGIRIEWPLENIGRVILSDKDKRLPGIGDGS